LKAKSLGAIVLKKEEEASGRGELALYPMISFFFTAEMISTHFSHLFR